MKKFVLSILAFIGILFLLEGQAAAQEKEVVYFYTPSCTVCQSVSSDIQDLKDQGVTVIEYNISNKQNLRLFDIYKATYLVPVEKGTVPIIFAGDEFFWGEDEIVDNIEDNTIQTLASQPLKEIDTDNYESSVNLEGFIGFVTILFSGLLDGFNPCAMAMLLMFISLLGFSSKRSTLILVSFTYIFALFISYFLLGTFLFNYLYRFQNQIKFISIYISWFILILCLFLFAFNFYDYFVSKKQDYKKIKNQLPKPIQKFNKLIIRKFTSLFSQEEHNARSLAVILVLTFTLGVIISVTEFMCTGQIYLPIIISLVQFSDSFNLNAILYLVLYNFMFVLPLILISVVSIKSRSVLLTSNIIREKLHVIKLLNALLFLGIAIVYLFKIF